MIIYATSPVKKVVAEVDIIDILEDTPDKVWMDTKEYSGTTREAYLRYYKGRDKVVAYKLGDVMIYDEPKELSDIGIDYVPQSFVYWD